MFSIICGKIKVLSQVVCWFGIIASIIIVIIMMLQNGEFLGLMVLIFGSLFSWIGFYMTYGFGQLIENTDILVADKKGMKEAISRPVEIVNDKIDTLNKWKEQGLINEEEYNQKMENL